MPKATVPNGFMMFVSKRKRELEISEGRKFGHINDAIEHFGPEWEAMSADERQPFTDAAKAKKEELKRKALQNDPGFGPTSGNTAHGEHTCV